MAQGRIYQVPLYASADLLSVSTNSDQDIWYIKAGASTKFRLLGFELSSMAIIAEPLRFRLCRRSTDGSAGAALVFPELDEGNTTTPDAAGFSLRTTPGTIGDVLATFAWEQIGQLHLVFTPEADITVQEGGRLALNLFTALGGTTKMGGYVTIEEL